MSISIVSGDGVTGASPLFVTTLLLATDRKSLKGDSLMDLRQITSSLLFKIVVAIILGIVCSFFFPEWLARVFVTFNGLVVSRGCGNTGIGYWFECSSLFSLSAGVSKLSVCRGRLLSWIATSSRSSAVWVLRSVPLGKYWRSSPLVFSLLPRCQGDPGSQK